MSEASGGKVRAVLAGRKQHLHMACETAGCNMRMMEWTTV